MSYTITIDQHNAMMHFEELLYAIRHGARATINVEVPDIYTSSMIFDACGESEQSKLETLSSTSSFRSTLQKIGK